jgi:methyl-accepting chemotaxis protein
MSSTIAAIRTDTENVAKDNEQLEQGFARFAEQNGESASKTKEFVTRVAA